MRVYFVRHGESDSNTKGIHLGEDVALSVNGKKQATLLAQRLAKIPLDAVITSSYPRAIETAEIINKTIKKPLEVIKHIVERKYPSEIIGKSWGDPHVKNIIQTIMDNFHVPGWKYADEESFEEIKHRALTFLTQLQKRKENNILVVSHGKYIKTLLACMLLGNELTPQQLLKFMYGTVLKNTGITLCVHEKEDTETASKGWHLITWSDHAHLG